MAHEVTMPRLSIVPKTETEWHMLRSVDVTSTESSALFGMSPYATAFELWHRKREEKIDATEARGRMLWGTRLQDTIARGIAEDYGVKVRRINAYMKQTDCRMGASFDFEIVGVDPSRYTREEGLRAMYNQLGPGVLEIKNVDGLIYKQQWIEERDHETGEIFREAPAHIEIQVQHQLHVIERKWAAIGVFVGGNNPIVITRERDLEVGQSIERRIREFWQSIEENNPPPPVYPDDAAFVSRLYGYAEPGKVYDGRQDPDLLALCDAYHAAARIAKQADEDKKVAKAKILEKIGDAEQALLAGFKVSAAMVGPTHVEFDRAGFRGFRVTQLKEKKAA